MPTRIAFLITLLTLAASPARAQAPPPAAAPAAAAPPAAGAEDAQAAEKARLFAEAKAVYGKRASLKQHKRAFRLFRDLAKAHPTDRDLQVWCARTAYYCAHRIESSKQKSRVARAGQACAKRMLKLNKKDYDGRLWRALNRFKGELAEAFILPSKKELKRIVGFIEAMRRDEPRRPEAYMLLGAIYRDLPGWPISFGDEEKGMKLLKQGARYAGSDAEYLLELAAGYAAVGQEDKAREVYTRCIEKGTARQHLDWEATDARAYAKKMRSEL